MNRIIDIRDLDDQIKVTTTDVHLPRRIGKAIDVAIVRIDTSHLMRNDEASHRGLSK